MIKYEVCVMYQLFNIIEVEAEDEDDAAEKALDSPLNDVDRATSDDEYVAWVHAL